MQYNPSSTWPTRTVVYVWRGRRGEKVADRDQPLLYRYTSAAINSYATLISKNKTEFHPRRLHKYLITEKDAERFISTRYFIFFVFQQKEKEIDSKIWFY